MFQLVFKGECTPGTDPEKAREGAKALFKANADQIQRMFSGQPVVIRNKLEELQAEKYRAVLAKHGMVAYVESMGGAPAPKPAPEPDTAASAEPAQAAPKPPAQPAPQQPRQEPVSQPKPAAPSGGQVKVEPGERPNVAGEKVDDILSGSGLTLDPVGVTLEEHKEHAPPMFEHLDEWTIAPPGTELGEEKETPPPVVPDVSHLSLADQDRKDER